MTTPKKKKKSGNGHANGNGHGNGHAHVHGPGCDHGHEHEHPVGKPHRAAGGAHAAAEYALDLEQPVDTPPPPAILELAAACVRFVATMVRLEPDFTSETLSLVDHYVREARREVRDRPEALPVVAAAVGAYLGEMARRAHRAWWNVASSEPRGYCLEFEAVFLRFYPVDVAHALLEGAALDDEEGELGGFEVRDEDHDALAARLADLLVTEEEYLLPSMRLEALDIVVETLLAKRTRDPLASRAFRPRDYA